MIKDTFYQRLGYASSEDRRGLAGFQARILLKIPKAKKDSKYPQEAEPAKGQPQKNKKTTSQRARE